MKFTKQTIAALSLPEGKPDHIEWDPDLPNFGVRLRASGKKVWVIFYRVGARQSRETLGDVRKIDLEAARSIAKKRFAEVTLGGDPASDRAKAKARDALKLGPLADRYLEIKQPVLRPNSYVASKRYLTQHFKPLHRLPIHNIQRRDIAVALGTIVKENGVTSAARARSALSAFFVWAIKEGVADINPVMGTNNPGEGLTSRDRVLTADEILAIWRASGDDDFGRIIRLLILTGCRRDEIGGLRWPEIDLDRAMLNIPGTRSKNHHPLNLPLSPAALSILESAPRREGREYVFGGRGGAFSAWSYATLALHTRIAETRGAALAPWRIHDIRRTVATGMAELGAQPHIVETCLNHRSGHRRGVAGTYNRASYEREVRAALLMWADHVQSIVEGSERKVIPLRPVAS